MPEAPIRNRIAPVRLAARTVALGLCVVATAVCGEQGRFGGGVTGPGTDTESPVVRIIMPGVPADTALVDLTDSLKFTARATDNVRLSRVIVRVVGRGSLAIDETVMDSTTTSTVLTVQKDFAIYLPPSAAGQLLVVRIEATDAAGSSARDSQVVAIDDPTPPDVRLRSPASGTTVPAGGTLAVSASASDPSGVLAMGARVFFNNALGQPVAIAGDSQTYTAPLTNTRIDTFNIALPDTLAPGVYTVHAFAVDGRSPTGNDTTTSSISVTVADTTGPTVTFPSPYAGATWPAGDSIPVRVRAQDLTGVAQFTIRGYSRRGVDSLGTGVDVSRFTLKTVLLPANPTDTAVTRWLNAVLSDSTAEKVYLEAVVTDVGGNADTLRDSVTIIAGSSVRIASPADSARMSVGSTFNITIIGRDPHTLSRLGFIASGAIQTADTLTSTGAAQVEDTLTLSLTVPSTTPQTSATITPYGRDVLGNRFTGLPITIVFTDTTRPTVTVLGPTLDTNVTAGDSVLVRVRVLDSSGVSSITLAGVSVRGDSALGTDESVTRFETKTVSLAANPVDTTVSRYLLPNYADSTVEAVYISVTATDALGNQTRTLRRIQIDPGPFVAIARPAPGTEVPVNSQYDVIVTGYDPDSLRYLGVMASGRVVAKDSIEIIRPETRRSQAVPITFPLTVRQPLGVDTLIPFAIDFLGNRFTGRPVVVTLKDLLPPYVEIQQPDSLGNDIIPSGSSAIVRVRLLDDRSVDTVTIMGLNRERLATHILPTGWAYGLEGGPLDTAIVAETLLVDTVSIPTVDANGRTWIVVRAVDSTGNVGWDSVRVTVAAPPAPIIDSIAPTITIVQPTIAGIPVTVGDSVLIRVRVQDGAGVDSVILTGIARRGVDSLGTATDVQRFGTKTIVLPSVTDTTFSRYLLPFGGDSTSEPVALIVTAVDTSGNRSVDSIAVTIVGGPTVDVIRPDAGTTTAPAKSLVVEIRAVDPQGVSLVGYRVSGVYTFQDSAFFPIASGALADTATFTDTLTIPLATPLGSILITPFALDSAGDRSGTHPGVSVTVASTAGDATAPQVTFSVERRVETDDSITVNAVDAGGIRRVKFTATILGGAQVSADSTSPDLNGTLSDVTRTFSLNLPVPPAIRFPAQVVVRAFALDSAGNLGASVAETLTVVAGKTYQLPAGSVIGDAVYNANRSELYLANTAYDRIEIFDLATSAFVASVPVGSRPTSVSMMPRDTLGNYRDTLIVANSGGTNLSIVDVTTGTLTARSEIRRHRLPNFQVQTIKTAASATGTDILITQYEFSDRPFQIAPLCVNYLDASGRCGRVRVVYSTTPTPGQSSPFPNRGYLAWSELDTVGTIGLPVHLVYEYSPGGRDSLQIIAVRDVTPGALVRDTILGAGVGRLIEISGLPFRENSFVRASGDFLHALVGEGGTIDFARALTIDARPAAFIRDSVFGDTTGACAVVGFALKCDGLRDLGVSDIVQVGDLVTNRSAQVTSVAINYNGRTNLVRADSIYAFDYVLKQQGMMQISAANGAVGMDFHPCNNFDATTRTATPLAGCAASYTPDERMVFAARPDSSLDVFDTYFYGRVTDTTSTSSSIPIPIRNALVGPVRVADVTGATVLFGFTAHGLVVVNLPTVDNSLFPVRNFTDTGGGIRNPRGRGGIR